MPVVHLRLSPTNPLIMSLMLQLSRPPFRGALPQVLRLLRGLSHRFLWLPAVLHQQAQLGVHHLLQHAAVQRASPEETSAAISWRGGEHAAAARARPQSGVLGAVLTGHRCCFDGLEVSRIKRHLDWLLEALLSCAESRFHHRVCGCGGQRGGGRTRIGPVRRTADGSPWVMDTRG